MAKPHVHAESSARRFGGKPEDYLDLHEFLDSSKAALCDNRHRALTHNAWFVRVVVPLVFGSTRINADGRTYSTVEVAEWHVAEDFGGYVPSAQDFLAAMPLLPWMDNGKGRPPSQAMLISGTKGRD